MTRKALYELVWSKPVKDLAAKLRISDVGLASSAPRHVPVPPRGYWAKLDAGQPVERTPLPPESPNRSGVVGAG